MWLFITVEGVEPTNNAAERAIRPAVLWRRTSFGAQSQAGSVFVARMLTVVTTLHSESERLGVFKPSLSGCTRRQILHRCCLIRVDARAKTVCCLTPLVDTFYQVAFNCHQLFAEIV